MRRVVPAASTERASVASGALLGRRSAPPVTSIRGTASGAKAVRLESGAVVLVDSGAAAATTAPSVTAAPRVAETPQTRAVAPAVPRATDARERLAPPPHASVVEGFNFDVAAGDDDGDDGGGGVGAVGGRLARVVELGHGRGNDGFAGDSQYGGGEVGDGDGERFSLAPPRPATLAPAFNFAAADAPTATAAAPPPPSQQPPPCAYRVGAFVASYGTSASAAPPKRRRSFRWSATEEAALADARSAGPFDAAMRVTPPPPVTAFFERQAARARHGGGGGGGGGDGE